MNRYLLWSMPWRSRHEAVAHDRWKPISTFLVTGDESLGTRLCLTDKFNRSISPPIKEKPILNR
jgi:hypothetical protein